MKLPWKRQRNKLSGEQLFLNAVDIGFSSLGSGTMENLYRASLVGASWAAASHIKVSPQLSVLWGRGDTTKAARLLEVWSSTIAVRLLEGESDKEAVCRGVARGFATVVFDRSIDEPLLELRTFMEQLEADHRAVMPGGFYLPGKAMQLFYLRCVRALGVAVDFKRILTPLPAGTNIMDLNVVESRYCIASLGDLLKLDYLYSVYSATTQRLWNSGASLQSSESAQTVYGRMLVEVSDSLRQV